MLNEPLVLVVCEILYTNSFKLYTRPFLSTLTSLHQTTQHNPPISISGKTFVVKKSYRLRRALPCYAVAIIPHHITRTVSIPPLFLSVYFFFVSLLYSPPTFFNRHFVSFALASISIAQTHENNSLKSQTAIENESAKEWC